MPHLTSINPLHHVNSARPIFTRYYKWKMDKYIGIMLDERFAVRDAKLSRTSRKQTGVDLALEGYMKSKYQYFDAKAVTIDAEFRKAAIDNLLILLFAGYDTTAATLCYCCHLLENRPAELAKVRSELDIISGTGTHAGPQLTANPYLINKLD